MTGEFLDTPETVECIGNDFDFIVMALKIANLEASRKHAKKRVWGFTEKQWNAFYNKKCLAHFLADGEYVHVVSGVKGLGSIFSRPVFEIMFMVMDYGDDIQNN